MNARIRTREEKKKEEGGGREREREREKERERTHISFLAKVGNKSITDPRKHASNFDISRLLEKRPIDHRLEEEKINIKDSWKM